MTEVIETLQLNACEGRYRGWKRMDIPADGTFSALVLQFEACATEDIRIGFASPYSTDQQAEATEEDPKPTSKATQWLYELTIGGNGNTEIIWRKCLPATKSHAPKELDLLKVFCGRTCTTAEFINYWIVMHDGQLAFGIGDQIGQDLIANFTDDKFPGMPTQVAVTNWDLPASFRHVRYKTIGSTDENAWKIIDMAAPRIMIRADPYGKQDLLQDQERQQYLQAYETAKKRSERFGGVFHAPELKQFVDPKLVRKLQRTGRMPTPGFVTGFDVTSQEEKEKREQRMKRFNTPQFGAVEYTTETARALADGMTQEEWQEHQDQQEKLRQRAKKFGLEAPETTSMNLKPASAKVDQERCDIASDTMVEYRGDAIHVYSLDAHFQQVRTNDVLQYFVGYGPSYVEWINDSSCTVVFDDAFTASRALIALSKQIPSQTKTVEKTKPVDDTAPTVDQDVDMDQEQDQNQNATANDTSTMDVEQKQEQAEPVADEAFNRSEWRYALPITSSSVSHKAWRLLLRKATAEDFPPEKNRKYHDRAYNQNKKPMTQRGRGHQNALYSSNSMPSRYGGGGGGLSSRRRHNSHHHPYRRERRGGRRNNRQGDENDQDDGPAVYEDRAGSPVAAADQDHIKSESIKTE